MDASDVRSVVAVQAHYDAVQLSQWRSFKFAMSRVCYASVK